MGKRVFKIFVLLLCMQASLFAQQVTTTTEQQLENLSEVTESETEDDSYLQQLQYFLKSPLNINTATEEDLQLFKMLSPLQVYHLLQYRQRFGQLINIYELQAVPMWDVATIRKIIPYITVQTKLDEKAFKRFVAGDQYILARASQILEKQKGFEKVLPTHYNGNRQRYLLRYNYQYKNLLQYGFTADKDAGEQFFKGAQSKGFDFYSAHLFARKLGVVKALAIGDFTINLGQGLVQWQSLAFKKSAEVLAIERQSPILLPYRSAGEFYFNRGIGATFAKKNWEATTFGSYRKLDANIVTDTLGIEDHFTSFGTSGYHRTATEIDNKNTLAQTSFGGNITYKTPSFKLGVNAVQYHFSQPLHKRDEPYNLYSIKSSNWFNGSIDYAATYKNAHFFGETAIDKKGNKAFINGTNISVDPKVDVSFLYRNINAGYQTLYGNAFTENTTPVNESGLYAGISVRPNVNWRLQAYADVYKFPWLKYKVDAPSSGRDYLLQVVYQPDKKIELYARYRYEQKMLNAISNTPLNYTSYYTKQNSRVNIVYNISNVLSVKSRIEATWYQMQNKNEEGFLIYLEATYKPSMSFTVNGRVQWFETNGYNSRIYVYESDVLYGYSIPAFFDKGTRYYINLNYDISKSISAWLRYANTIYIGKEKVGSGLDESAGNKRSEVKFQIRIIL